MAFNFNWSPLIADTVRIREMLTTALNKSPKPPIIVSDIYVTELNLGKQPPDLDILEIGDLAEDRFRGIFKISYAGDAFLTLKTRVQANPLNTHLSPKPEFTSPQPLAAGSTLTIPLEVTLSDFRLSGFVILVFSKQKGVTVVFRNDPLESLKVSSTFDSIPFVRDYLQEVIERQLRVLFMEDLPAIIHRLSLRLWSPDYCDPSELISPPNDDSKLPVDPLAGPPQDPIDWLSRSFGEDVVPSISLENPIDPYATFSQKNLQRLATLSETQHTLSLATPNISDVVFRAWAIAYERSSGHHTPSAPIAHGALSGASSTYSFISGVESEPLPRPTLAASSYSRPTLGRAQRKRKHRIIDLRRTRTEPVDQPDNVSLSPTPEPSLTPSSPVDRTMEEPPRSPSKVRFTPTPRRHVEILPTVRVDDEGAPPAYTPPEPSNPTKQDEFPSEKPRFHLRTTKRPTSLPGSLPLLRSLSADNLESLAPSGSNGGILEQAWLQKMKREINRRVEDERAAQSSSTDQSVVQSLEAVLASVMSSSSPVAPVSGKGRDSLSMSSGEEIDAPPAYGM